MSQTVLPASPPENAATRDRVPPRERIIEAAMACFSRSGFHGASMQEICAEAGMSPGALYRYFPSKVSIIEAIAEAERAQHAAFFQRMADADDPVEALTSIGVETLERILSGPTAALTAEIMAEGVRNPDIRRGFERNIREARASVAGALRRGQERGLVDPHLDVDAAVQLIMAMGDGLMVHQGLDPSMGAPRLRPALQQLLRRFLRPAALVVVALLPVLGAIVFATPARAASLADARPPAVTVVPATAGTIAETVVLTGTLVPREEVVVSPQIEGLAITEILAEEGDTVQAGQVLARLSRDVLQASIAQNAAQAARAEAAVAQARALIGEVQAVKQQADLALARTRELVAGGNAAREVFEQRAAAATTAAARVESAAMAVRAAEADLAYARAQRQELLVRLGRTELRAPVAGLVSRRAARLGAVVAGAGDPLFRIIANGAVELEADVPETQLARLRPGQPARLDTAGGPRTGKVRLVSPEVSRTTRLGRVRVEVTDGQPLVIGSFARAAVEVARRDGLLAPLSAILFQPEGAVVQVVRDGVVDTRRVQVGLRNGQQAEITSGLAPGDEVVSVSGTFIRGGDRVVAVRAEVTQAGAK